MDNKYAINQRTTNEAFLQYLLDIRADILLLAKTDEYHQTLSGPATKKLLERAYQIYNDDAYERLAFIYDYGTSRRFVKDSLAKGNDVILEIDWQGHQQIKRLCPDAISIFILPPSLKDLKERLIKRNQDKSDIIQIRLADVKKAVSYIHEFDYVVINDDFTKALSDLTTIIHAGRLLEPPQAIRFAPLLGELLEGKG